MCIDTVLILANGEWGDTTRLGELSDRADRVIAADGAWAKASASARNATPKRECIAFPYVKRRSLFAPVASPQRVM